MTILNIVVPVLREINDKAIFLWARLLHRGDSYCQLPNALKCFIEQGTPQ